ncbi:hypothetical protein [Lacticaseibacillus jixiensis]|uniref:hypothetical protein n=1 Tax=Lacticaseibacillus jixiensis TaxID=3231926 RepID=UPI0036F37DB2
MPISLQLKTATETLAEHTANNEAYLAWRHQYAQGDYYEITVDHAPCFIVARLDGALPESLVYLTKPTWQYQIPFNTQRESPYPDGAFIGQHHYASVRLATPAEIGGDRNLAVNAHDQHAATSVFPHAFANAETRNEAAFFAKNAIDGVLANAAHGNYPFASWGVAMRDDAQFTLEFGRPVVIDQVVLYLRADYPHDSYWTNATLIGSDNSRQTLTLHKTAAPQVYAFAPRTVEWLRLQQLVKVPDSSTFPALTQIQVFGHER